MNETDRPVQAIPPPQDGIQHHWSFIRVGLWASLTILVLLLSVGLWSYQQTNQLVQQSQMRTGNALAIGLANAVEENLILRNFAQLEVQLLQFMANQQLQHAIVADANGLILSEALRDPASGKVTIVYNDAGKTLPTLQASQTSYDHTLEILQPVGSHTNAGWIALRIAMGSDSALLEGIHQKLSLILGLGAIVMLMIVAFSLRSTYSRVKTSQSQMEALNDSLHSAAFHDPLTQLPNRHLLRDRLNQAVALAARSRKQVAVCYLDLDGFKAVNDQYGHDVGDILLCEIAKRLTLALRQHDTVARIGGDEFVLLITELHGPEDCRGLLDRLLIDVAQPVDIGGHLVNVSASIGVAMSHEHGIDPVSLISLADKAMYRAKATGKNRWQLYEPMDELAA